MCDLCDPTRPDLTGDDDVLESFSERISRNRFTAIQRRRIEDRGRVQLHGGPD